MLICQNCGAKQLQGTIFCAECGAALIVEQRTAQAPMARAPAVPVLSRAVPANSTPTITLVVASSGRRVQLLVEDEVLIGRKDEARGIFPEVDLSTEGGYDAGVSRRHAIVSHRNGVYRVEDLGSANGTFINNRQITPQSSATVADGDELRCGTLVLRVALHQ